ncbi:MAG: HlyC/CorC family transporter [Firmicutes bacterium]|nr:HlyC/CorC family transporter [Bacillota bacterium]
MHPSAGWILLAIVLIALNAVFVVAEFSLVAAEPVRLRQERKKGNRRASRALTLVRDLDRTLSATQLGITLASLGLGWLGEPAFAALFGPAFEALHLSPSAAHTVGGIVGFILLTILEIVFGELVPKAVAIRYPERSALFITPFLSGFELVFRFAVVALDAMASAVARLFHASGAVANGGVHSEEEIRMLMAQSHEQGTLSDTDYRLVEAAFNFGDRIAREVMVPREDAIVLYTDMDWDDLLEVMQRFGHTRYPVCEEEKDHVIGIVNVRELLRQGGYPQKGPVPWEKVVRPVRTVPGTIPVATLLRQMQQAREHMVIVADEYGGMAGICTMEDILEALVGEIPDENEQEPAPWRSLPSGGFAAAGDLLIEEVADQLGVDLPPVEGTETIGGWVFGRLGREPRPGDEVEEAGYRFQVSKQQGSRILELHILPIEAQDEQPIEEIQAVEETEEQGEKSEATTSWEKTGEGG